MQVVCNFWEKNDLKSYWLATSNKWKIHTLATDIGSLNSFPPWILNPQGGPPFRTTAYDITYILLDRHQVYKLKNQMGVMWRSPTWREACLAKNRFTLQLFVKTLLYFYLINQKSFISIQLFLNVYQTV